MESEKMVIGPDDRVSDMDPGEIRRAEDALSETRTGLMMDRRATFFGALALRLKLVPDMVKSQETAATDGHGLFYNPTWINELTRKKLTGLVAHEAGHVLMEHTLRREGRDRYDWNVACDHALNNMLSEAGFELPDDGFCDPQYAGWSAEEIYAAIHQEREKEEETEEPGDGDGEEDREPDSGDVAGDSEPTQSKRPGTDAGNQSKSVQRVKVELKLPAGAVLDSPDPVADKADIAVMVMEAAMCAKAAGGMPEGVARLVNSLTRTKVDLQTQMQTFVANAVQEDYSFKHPNRRYLASGVYLPSLRGMDDGSTPEMAFFMDTSGSRFSDAQLAQTVGALDATCAQLQPERVHVIACDTRVQWRKVFERGEALAVETPGGGGTNFDPPFRALEDDGIEPACAIYITDGYGRWPEKEPPYPVMWIITTPHIEAPWGVTVHLDEPNGARP